MMPRGLWSTGITLVALGHAGCAASPEAIPPGAPAGARAAVAAETVPADAEASRVRLTASEIDAQDKAGPGAGTSGVVGIQTGTLKGDPTQPGLYTIVLRVPANTQIEAHEHPDDRMATVVSGTWYFGYGDHYDDATLKALPPGSFYTEPPGQMHFARTRETPVVVQITGYGPTGTVFAEAAHAAR